MVENRAPDEDRISETKNNRSNHANTVEHRSGLLDIKINLSNPEPTAGSEFTVYVLVTNPFDVPIWPFPPQVFLPSEVKPSFSTEKFQDSIQNLSSFLSQAAKGKVAPTVDDGFSNPLQLKKKFRMKDVLRYLARRTIELDEKIVEIERKLDLLGKRKKEIVDGKSFAEKQEIFNCNPEFKQLYEEESIYLEGINSIREEINALTTQLVILTGSSAIVTESDLNISTLRADSKIYVQAKGDVNLKLATTQLVTLNSSLEPGTALQPGNTVVYSIALTTTKTLFFRPIQYILQYSINFSFTPIDDESVLHTNTIAQTLTIRAPIFSVMSGAAVGGFTGAFANMLQKLDRMSSTDTLTGGWLPLGVTLVVSVILSVMAVVFLARKSDTQSLVSVEDFWGGLVIGFLVGYTGTSFFDSLAGIGSPTMDFPKLSN